MIGVQDCDVFRLFTVLLNFVSLGHLHASLVMYMLDVYVCYEYYLVFST